MPHYQIPKESTEPASKDLAIEHPLPEYYRIYHRVFSADRHKKTAAYLVVCTLAMLCLCTATIEVTFNLANEEKTDICRLSRDVFKTIDNLETHHLALPKKKHPRLDIEKECEITLSNITTHEQYKHFKAFWETDLAALSAEEDNALLQYQTDLTPDLFYSFLFTADYLEIQGEHAKYFAQNMVQYGLLGQHSEDITDLSQCKDKALPYSTFEPMLPVFLDQIDFMHKTIVHSDKKKKTLLIEKKYIKHSRLIHEEYIGPSQTETRRTVLYSELGPALSQEKRRNEAVLGWLLSNTEGSSVDIQYTTVNSSEGLSELKTTIHNFTKESKKAPRVYVEGLTLDVNYKTNNSLLPAFQLVPDLSCLNLSIFPTYLSDIEGFSLINEIASCKSLKALRITRLYLNNVLISRLVESLPAIEHLRFWCWFLGSTPIEKLANCTHLEILEVLDNCGPSSTVLTVLLVGHLPSLKELKIKCQSLDSAAAESFTTCSQLEKLELYEDCQSGPIIQEILKHLPSLKELKIKCHPLEPADAESFKTCSQLETLEVKGANQKSTVVQEILKNLPLLRELRIKSQILEPAAAKSFKACKKLEKLKMTGWFQKSTVVQEIVNHLPLLKDLTIECQALDPAATMSFKACSQLEKLELTGWNQTSNTVQEMVNYLPLLKELKIKSQILDSAVAESFKICSQLENLDLVRYYISNITMREILKHLPSLKELKIKCQSLDPADAESFKTCSQLESLEVKGENQKSTVVQEILKNLPLLRELRIKSQILELAAAESFKACSQLENLEILGTNQLNSTLEILYKHLPLLKELIIDCEAIDPTVAEGFKACKKLEKLVIRGVYQPSSSVQALVSHLSSLKYLEISTDTTDLALAAALQKCPTLCSIILLVSQYTPGFLTHYMQAPLPSLKSLKILPMSASNSYSEEDFRVVEEAYAMGISAYLS
ncbi:hypothetical protein NECID01_0055 [Nematocida sp. AWRm77]|nr:hypothetical protein NECID01_0055 [Nematocida sp. AWRm77]